MVNTLDEMLLEQVVRLAGPKERYPEGTAQMYGKALFNLIRIVGESMDGKLTKYLTVESISRNLYRGGFVDSKENAVAVANDILSRNDETTNSLGTGFKLSKVVTNSLENNSHYIIQSTGLPSLYIPHEH